MPLALVSPRQRGGAGQQYNGKRFRGFMVNGKKIVLVMPAYNAASTLRKTYDEVPHDIVDDIVLVDDCSCDDTVEVARELGLTTVLHASNTGYGGNQKSCYA